MAYKATKKEQRIRRAWIWEARKTEEEGPHREGSEGCNSRWSVPRSKQTKRLGRLREHLENMTFSATEINAFLPRAGRLTKGE
jgi:hypothetical protein